MSDEEDAEARADTRMERDALVHTPPPRQCHVPSTTPSSLPLVAAADRAVWLPRTRVAAAPPQTLPTLLSAPRAAATAMATHDDAIATESTTFRRNERTNSQLKFTTQGDSAIELAMRRELAKLVASAPPEEHVVRNAPHAHICVRMRPH